MAVPELIITPLCRQRRRCFSGTLSAMPVHSGVMLSPSTYPSLDEPLAIPVSTERFANPQLIAWNAPLAAALGMNGLEDDRDRLARQFSGTEALPGTQPVALAYAGHQFGHFVPSLGDGRAALLGEVEVAGARFDLQLKGAGRTPFSRGGDGRSAMGPVLREYLLSEAMHALGVPTTRALAAVATGDTVVRDALTPAAVLTRVAASHLRVGSFEYYAVRGDKAAVQSLLDYSISRHQPELAELTLDERVAQFLAGVAGRQAALIAAWMSIGFIHGVMNTDNTAISGETLDYGPCAFMDEFKRQKVFSSIDRGGRYSYSNQPGIAQWNLARLADCLLLISEDRDRLESIVVEFAEQYGAAYLERMAPKFGFATPLTGDNELFDEFLSMLEEGGLDFTLSFRQLIERVNATDDAAFGAFEYRWRERLRAESEFSPEVAVDRMSSANPLYIPRNHQVEAVIQAAESGDLKPFATLGEVLAEPFNDRVGFESYAEAPAPEQRVTRTFCGT